MPLTGEAVKNAKSKEKLYRLFDGHGLYLEVTPNGSKYFRLKYRFNSKQKVLALGVYPDVNLKQARLLRDEARAFLRKNIDPSEIRKAERQAQYEAKAREIAETRFLLDSKGSLSIKLGNRAVILTPDETRELRVFLNVTHKL